MGRFGDDKNANNPNPSEMSGIIIEINGSGEILKSNKIISTNGIFLNTVGAFEKMKRYIFLPHNHILKLEIH